MNSEPNFNQPNRYCDSTTTSTLDLLIILCYTYQLCKQNALDEGRLALWQNRIYIVYKPFLFKKADATGDRVDHLMSYLHWFQIDRYRKLLVHEVWEASVLQINYNFLNYMILVSWVSIVTGYRVDNGFNCQWSTVNVIFASALRQHYPRGAKGSFFQGKVCSWPVTPICSEMCGAWPPVPYNIGICSLCDVIL